MAPTWFVNGLLLSVGLHLTSCLLYSEPNCFRAPNLCFPATDELFLVNKTALELELANLLIHSKTDTPIKITEKVAITGETLENTFLPDLTPTCLGCICEATSNCNLTIGCLGRLCGPFLITKTYWLDAGRPVLFRDHWAREGAYETCVNDPFCAAQTVRQYMAKYVQDCNRNGYLDCDDYARIHYLGGRQCYLPIHQYGYYKVFRNCQAIVRFLN